MIRESFPIITLLDGIATYKEKENDKDTFLIDESIRKKLKDMAIFFATIIPVVIT
jgi:hypothetical protein